MTTRRGISLELRGTAVTVVGARAVGPARWDLEVATTTPVDRRPEGEAAAPLADTDAKALLLLPNDRAGSAVTAMPRLKPAELKRAVAGWAAREGGVALADSAVSWRALPTRRGGRGEQSQDVFAVFASRAALGESTRTLAPWGRTPDHALPAFMVLDEFFRAAGPDAGALRAWNLVFLGGAQNFLCVATAEALLLVRPLPSDLSAGVRPDEYLDRLATEVERSVFFARQTEGSPEVERLVVCGEPGLAAGLVARLREESDIPALHWDLAACFAAPRPLTPDLLLPAAAAALATGDLRYDLLGRHGRGVLGPRARRRLAVAAIAAGAALLPLLLVGGLATARVQERYLADAHRRLDGARQRADAAAEVYARERILLAREDCIRRHTATERDLEGVLKRLAAATPAQVVYTDLQVVDRGERVILHLAGRSRAPALADAQQAFMTFQAALDGDPALRARGEPRRLEIVEKDDAGLERPQVEFRLEYEVVPRGGTGSEGP